jgi:hypothetical protein
VAVDGRHLEAQAVTGLDVDRVRAHFDFVAHGRVVTNNAARLDAPSRQPTGERRSLLLVDGAQLVPGRAVDVRDLAHRALGLDPPASCRLSFALYNSEEDVDRAVAAVAAG